MRWLISLALALCQLSAFALGKSAYGHRLLVVLDALSEQDRFSQFWSSLQDRGFDLTFRDAASGPALMQEAEPAFDHVVLFAPRSKQLSKDLSPQSLFAFLGDASAVRPHNMLVALSPDASELWKDLAREFSIDFDSKNSILIDHHHFEPSLDTAKTHSVVAVQPPARPQDASLGSRPIVSQGAPVLYQGIAHTTPAYFPLATTLLTGSPTSYSYDQPLDNVEHQPIVESDLDGSNGPALVGQEAKLVSAFQTLTGSRALWSGSLDLFSDDFLQAQVSGKPSGNAAFVKDASQWTFQEEGVLRVDAIRHHLVGDEEQRDQYRVRKELVYEIELSQWAKDQWQPVDLQDLQLEVTMLDPFWRVPLEPSSDCSPMLPTSTCYAATVKLPDRHGVFTLFVDYKRSGWTPVEEKRTIAITPPRHDEHARFLPGAWPYYAGSLVTVSVFLAFVTLWLGLEPSQAVSSSKKAQ